QRESPASAPSAGRPARAEPRDEVDLERGVDELLRLRHLGQSVDTIVRQRRDTLGRLEAGRGDESGERAEEPRVPRVRQTDETEMLHLASGYRAHPRLPLRSACRRR